VAAPREGFYIAALDIIHAYRYTKIMHDNSPTADATLFWIYFWASIVTGSVLMLSPEVDQGLTNNFRAAGFFWFFRETPFQNGLII